jgi:hypothetical protein
VGNLWDRKPEERTGAEPIEKPRKQGNNRAGQRTEQTEGGTRNPEHRDETKTKNSGEDRGRLKQRKGKAKFLNNFGSRKQ